MSKESSSNSVQRSESRLAGRGLLMNPPRCRSSVEGGIAVSEQWSVVDDDGTRGRTRTAFVWHDHIERAVDVRPGIPLDVPDNGLLWSSRHRSEERRVGKECPV